MEIPLPNATACRKILEDCLGGLSAVYPKIGHLLKHPKFEACAAEFVELDGRTIRKTVANALAADPTVATAPETVTIEQIAAAAQAARKTRTKKGGK